MFRISPNIQLYEANLADTFNMFDTAFITGGPTSRRIIIPSNDSLLQKFQTDGIWLKGDSTNSSEKNYYCGMEAVRLKMQSGVDSIGVPFAVGSEKEALGDVVGSIVGDAENSIFLINTIVVNEDNATDTLENTENPHLLPVNQTRFLKINHRYLYQNDRVKIFFNGDSIFLEQIQSNENSIGTRSIAIKTNLAKADSIKLLAYIFSTIDGQTLLSRCFKKNEYIGSIAIKCSQVSDNVRLANGLYPLALEKDTLKLLSYLRFKNGMINLRVTNSARVFASRDTIITNQLLPDVNGKFTVNANSTNNKNNIWVQWRQFYQDVLSLYDTLFVLTDYGDVGSFVIGYQELDNKNNTNKTATTTAGVEEKAVLTKPKIGWMVPSDKENYYGYDVKSIIGDIGYINIPNVPDATSKIVFGAVGLKSDLIKNIVFTSTNTDNVNVTSFTKRDISGSTVYDVKLKIGNSPVVNALDWLNVAIEGYSNDKIESKVGIVNYQWKIHPPVNVYFCEDTVSPDTKILNNKITTIPKNQLLNGVNRYLRQGVLQLEDMNGLHFVQSEFDLNHNGVVDFYASLGFGQPEWSILGDTLNTLRGLNTSRIVVAYVNKIRSNWMLHQNATKGSNQIIVKYSMAYEIEKGDVLIIGGDITKEQIVTIKENPIASWAGGQYIATILLEEKLWENHNTSESIWDGRKGLALVGNFILLVPGKNDGSNTFAHELLHISSFAGLGDVGLNDENDLDNLMLYYAKENKDDILRFRSIPTVISGKDGGKPDGGTNMQWDMIHNVTR